MSNFRFTLDDIMDLDQDEGLSTKTQEAVVREATKEQPAEISTTRSSNNYADGLDSTMGLADVLMGQSLLKHQSVGLQRNEYLMSSMLGGTLTSEDNEDGKLGMFDNLVPNDIRSYVDAKRREAGLSDAVAAGGDAGGTTANGEYSTEQYTFYSEQLIAHPNFRLQGRGDKDADYNRVLADLRDGLINPWLIATLKILADNFAIYIGNFDATKTSGHMKGSQHYLGNAVDIGDVGPKDSAYGVNKDPLSSGTAIVQEVFACLNSIHAPWRPTVVIGPTFPSFTGGKKGFIEGTSFSSDSNHSGRNGHFHIDCKVRPKPEDIPPVPTQSSSNTSTRPYASSDQKR